MGLDDRARVREFLQQLLAEQDDRAPFGDAESLVKAGRLDSLAVAKIVTFMETAFGVDFARVEFDPERFDTVAEIEGLIEESRDRA